MSALTGTVEGPRCEFDVAGWFSFVDAITSGNFHTGLGLNVSRVPTQKYVEDVALSKLRQKLSETPINLGVALGEYRSTAAMFTSALTSIRGLAQTLRGRRYADAVKYLISGEDPRLWGNNPAAVLAARRSADAWLGFTYGVMPLMKDVEGALQVLTRENGQPTIEIRASHFHQWREFAAAVLPPWQTHKIEISGFGRCSARLRIQVENPFLFDLYQTGVLNPLATVWELIPYSFVVDWALPIGNWLSNIQPPPGLGPMKGYTSFKASGVTKRETRSLPHPWYYWDTAGQSREILKERKLLDSLPTVRFDIPDLSLSRDQITSAVALLTQQVTQENSGSPLALRRRA